MRHILQAAITLTLISTSLPSSAQGDAAAQRRSSSPVSTVTTQLPRTAKPTHYAVEITPHADALTFDGKVTIDVVVLQPTDSITLHAAKLTFVNATLTQRKRDTPQPAMVSANDEEQTASFTFEKPLAPGNYVLSIAYSGVINTQSNGLFAADYTTPQGPRRALLTQFEAANARNFIPSWDEPNFKATFDLAVNVPAAQMAISNLPVAKSTAIAGGLKRVVFQPTPPMSTYLLFLGVGDFERATVKAENGTEIGVVAQTGKLDQAQFALESSRNILHEYNAYFGEPYPLPKLDNIAAPARYNAAMENWGAILSAEAYLLLDPAVAGIDDKQRAFGVAAHEIAHQWFGNLVTMAWWDDLWLNEGFANWMGARTTQKLHPEWDSNNMLPALRSRSAMQGDASATTHPVVQHVTTVEQADQAFDQITYNKGEAIIAMLEDYLGAEQWRDGVRRYIRQHRYGNTTTDDLWQQFDAVAPGKQFTQVAHDFTLQPGVPLIKVRTTCTVGSTTVDLEQGEYTLDRPNKTPLRWRVPVAVRGASGTLTRVLVDGTAQLQLPGCGGPVVVNAGQNGYFRTLYAPADFKVLRTGFSTLPVVDQMGALMDTSALATNALQPEADLLDLTTSVAATAPPDVWQVVAELFDGIDTVFDGAPKEQAAWRSYAASRLTPAFGNLGWDSRVNERSQVKVARAQLLSALGAMGEPAIVAEARRRFVAFESDPDALPPDLRKSVLDIVSRHADAATWDRLHVLAKAQTSNTLRTQYYVLLANTQDAALAQRALDLGMTSEPGGNIGMRMISQVARQHPDLAFDFAVAHREQVDTLIGATSRSGFYPRLVATSANRQTADKVKVYADHYLEPDARSNAEKAIAAIQTRATLRERRVPEIEAWLRGRKE
ncbi:M1 family metallopeptidase [Xanthomonas arboricola]|uniref:M1 family metallopeptidase n=1 Tax=Xanthomonas arboricola TaxID=56448 RepID=UPI002B30A3C3|nr:M1 family metallopeptidase [Xanthomonas arboricola]